MPEVDLEEMERIIETDPSALQYEMVAALIARVRELEALDIHTSVVKVLIGEAVAKEREACALLCDAETVHFPNTTNDAAEETAHSLAAAIRARGGK